METENIWEYKVDNNGFIANFVRCEKPECEDSAHRVGATKMIRFFCCCTQSSTPSYHNKWQCGQLQLG